MKNLEQMDILISNLFNLKVFVTELGYKDTDKENKKEVVFASFVTADKDLLTSDASFQLYSAKDSIAFEIKDIAKEYTHEVHNFGDTYLHIYNRHAVKGKVILNESIKRSISSMDPLVFISDSATFEEMEDVYQIGRQCSQFAYLSNMREPDLLSKHIESDDKEETIAIIKDITIDGGVNKKEFNTKQYALAEFYLGVYEKWVRKYFEICVETNALTKVQTHVTNMDSKAYFLKHDDDIIEPLLQEAIKSGELAFTKNTDAPTIEITNNIEYTKFYAKAQRHQANLISKPLHYNGVIRDEVREIIENSVTRKLYEGQLNAVDAMLKSLDVNNRSIIIGEMGTGKTTIMLVAAYTDATMNKVPMKLVILSPDHLVDSSWKEDVLSVFPAINIHKIESVSDLNEYEKSGFLDDEKHRVFILAQKHAKRKFGYAPSPVYNIKNRTFSCSSCGEVIKKKVRVNYPDGRLSHYEMQPVSNLFFNTKEPQAHNSNCDGCGESFWAIENKNTYKDKLMVYSSVLGGFVPNDLESFEESLLLLASSVPHNASQKTRTTIKNKIKMMQDLIKELKGVKKVIRRVSNDAAVAHFIHKKMKWRFNYLIIDEMHEYAGESLRFEACKWLVKSIRKVIAGTGTAMTGYADSRFQMDFLLFPKKMIKNGYRHNDKMRFQEDFGVVEKRYYMTEGPDGNPKKVTLRPIKKPSINPAVFPKFMQDCTVFLVMDDMEGDMPKLTYIPHPVEMDEELEGVYTEFIESVKRKTHGRRKDFASIFQVANSFLDAPGKQQYIMDPKTKEVLLTSPVVNQAVDKKLNALLDIIEDRVTHKGKNALIYVHYKNGGIKEYLKESIEKLGYKVALLEGVTDYSITHDGEKVKVEKESREFWIRNQVKLGAQVVICNPILVHTGCNLLELPVIINYQLSYNPNVIRQADRRAWRLSQTEECEVINIFYANSIQQQVAQLMATKIVAARAIEGLMEEDGLAALCNSRTPEEEMAAEFYKGLKEVG